MFQSVGMRHQQLSNMLSYECLYYVGIPLLVTLTLGTVCSLAVCRVFDQIGMFGTLTYHFPVFLVLLFGTALLLVQGVFSVCAVCYTRRLSLVKRIKAVDCPEHFMTSREHLNTKALNHHSPSGSLRKAVPPTKISRRSDL